MPSTRRLALVIGSFLVLLAACGPAQNPASPGGAGTPTATATGAAPSEPPASPSPAQTPSPAPSSAAAGDSLSELVPDSVGDITFTKTSVRGDDLSSLNSGDATVFEKVIEVTGIPPRDLEAVSALGDGLSIVAIRARGADVRLVGDTVVGALLELIAGGAEVTDVEVGGASVKQISSPSLAASFYVFLRDDIAFLIASDDEALVADAIELLG